MEVEMKIRGLMMDPVTQMPIVVLKDVQGQAILPIWVERDGELMSIDSRPSDALALALRMDCPIFVDESVLKHSKVTTALAERNTNEQLRNYLEGLSDEDLGRYKM